MSRWISCKWANEVCKQLRWALRSIPTFAFGTTVVVGLRPLHANGVGGFVELRLMMPGSRSTESFRSSADCGWRSTAWLPGRQTTLAASRQGADGVSRRNGEETDALPMRCGSCACVLLSCV